jgi:NDP-sugar pyrophosphorylase family protein
MLLAAGFGRRLRPLTDRLPKPLVVVGGKPLIAYTLALVRAAGIRDVVINLHHRADQMRAALGDGAAYGISIRYSEEDPILDTGGAIKRAQPLLADDTFVVLNTDIICDLDLRAPIAWHRAQRATATMVLRHDRDAARYGLIEVDASLLAADCPLYGYQFSGYWRVLDTHAGLAEGRWDALAADHLAPAHRP